MDQSSFNPTESLKTIEQALHETRSVRTDAAKYYLLWGIALSFYFALKFICLVIPSVKGSVFDSLSWIIFPIGGLISAVFSQKSKAKETSVSHFERVYLYAFIGFAMSYGIVYIYSSFNTMNIAVTLFPLIIGTTVFTVGGITKHRPSVIGGVVGILLSGISIFSTTEYQYLCASLAALISNVIPGLLMKNKHV